MSDLDTTLGELLGAIADRSPLAVLRQRADALVETPEARRYEPVREVAAGLAALLGFYDEPVDLDMLGEQLSTEVDALLFVLDECRGDDSADPATDASLDELLERLRNGPSQGAPLAQLVAWARRAVEVAPDADAIAETLEGIAALLDFYEEPIDHALVGAQLESELDALETLRAHDAADADEDAETRLDLADALRRQARAMAEAFASGDRGGLIRALHTLKGESSFARQPELTSFLHDLEDDLPTPLQAATWLPAALTWLEAAGEQVLAGGDLRPPAELLPDDVPPPAAAPAPKAASRADGLPEVVPALEAETAEMFPEFYAESCDALAEADEMLVHMDGQVDEDQIAALFRTFHTLKGLAGFLGMTLIQDLAHVSEARLDRARKDLTTFDSHTIDLLLQSTQMTLALIEARRASNATSTPMPVPAALGDLIRALERPSGVVVPMTSTTAAPVERREEPGSQVRRPAVNDGVRETLRVDLARIDSLVETIGELVIMEAMVVSASKEGLSDHARYKMTQLSKIVRDLQRQGLALRMVPLRGVFRKMGRLVRDLSRKADKDVELILEGQDAEMDRSVAERLGDPLIHMVRNAIDHGLESAEERVAAGKPARGTVRLSAFHEGGSIVIELSDDGRGLDRDRILAKAVRNGLVAEGATLTDREVYDLVFQPGFSTAAKVTEISGRGVGMDVVKRTIEDLRGRIQILSEPGAGTTFRFVLPLTLAIIDGMLVACGDDRYVLPTLSVEESLQPEAHQLHTFASDGMLLTVRGRQLPLVNLAEVLQVDAPSRNDPTKGLVMVVDGVAGRFGLVVDAVLGQQQVVIKNLASAINADQVFSGAAILSDGQVGLILNASGLMGSRHSGLHLAS
jgi:two-component system chemotaxis sensor kinase CheA